MPDEKPQSVADPFPMPDAKPADKPEDKKEPVTDDLKPKTEAGDDVFSASDDKVFQNEHMTQTEHIVGPSFLAHLDPGACAEHEKPEYGSADELINALALHTMSTTNDVVLHEKLKGHLNARGVKVSEE